MKSLVIFFAVLAVLATVHGRVHLPGLDVLEKTVNSATGAVVGGATGAVKGGVEGVKSGIRDGVGGLIDTKPGQVAPKDLLDTGRFIIDQ